MATESQRPKEHPSTYVVQDQTNEEELIRVELQDKLVTEGMGGVLPEQEELSRFQRVLDVGCGTGNWIMTLAQELPSATLLVGVDVNRSMIEYARKQAKEAGLAGRVEFRVMDALRMLEFQQGFFDLVNQRFGATYLRTWDWPNVLQEFQRVTKPGGVIRVTDCDMPTSNAPAFNSLQELFGSAMNQSGHLFSEQSDEPAPAQPDAITNILEPMMQKVGMLNVQTRPHILEYPAGTPAGEIFAKDVQHLFRTAAPFLRKWVKVPGEYDKLYQQAVHEMSQPGFVATWRLVTAWGTNPPMDRRRVFDTH